MRSAQKRLPDARDAARPIPSDPGGRAPRAARPALRHPVDIVRPARDTRVVPSSITSGSPPTRDANRKATVARTSPRAAPARKALCCDGTAETDGRPTARAPRSRALARKHDIVLKAVLDEPWRSTDSSGSGPSPISTSRAGTRCPHAPDDPRRRPRRVHGREVGALQMT